MIRKGRNHDFEKIMEIWLFTNQKAHNFIPETYWINHYDPVKEMLPCAELYIYEDDSTGEMEGFTGLMENEIAGIFVREQAQSKGIGTQLMDYAKSLRQSLTLHVYQKNKRAISFYQREAFVIQSEGLDNDTGEREFLMVWRKEGIHATGIYRD